jgi:hypothetical protein
MVYNKQAAPTTCNYGSSQNNLITIDCPGGNKYCAVCSLLIFKIMIWQKEVLVLNKFLYLKYGTGPYNSVLQASQFFGCLNSCSCGYQTVTFQGGITQTIYISTLKCCGSSNNCNSATSSSLYTVFCNKATLLFSSNKFVLAPIATFTIYSISF